MTKLNSVLLWTSAVAWTGMVVGCSGESVTNQTPGEGAGGQVESTGGNDAAGGSQAVGGSLAAGGAPGTCGDTQSDEANCGGCGKACLAGAACNGGICACPASAPELCSTGCVDFATDEANCGSCGTACAPGQACHAGSCQQASCAGLSTLCQGESCCTAVPIPGGTFWMGPGTVANTVSQQMTVSDYALDKYEVTVGRFRKFVEAYTEGWRPADGAGAHATIAGSGWQSTWNESLPEDGAALTTKLEGLLGASTWTDTPGVNEAAAQNYVGWYEAMAFCIWDGGYLPTEAEWEYAAAGGSEERTYPWGTATPTATMANFYPDGTELDAVGSHPLGAGRWGHQDLGGGMFEWTRDWWSPYIQRGGVDVANLIEPPQGSVPAFVVRGGSWGYDESVMHAASRSFARGGPNPYGGFRCARKP